MKQREEMIIDIATEMREWLLNRCNEHNATVPAHQSVGMAAVLERAESDHTQAKRDYYNGEKRARR